MERLPAYRALAPVPPGLMAWHHGGPEAVPLPHRMLPFWYASVALRRIWSARGHVLSVRAEVLGPASRPYIYAPRERTEILGVAFQAELSPDLTGARLDELDGVRGPWMDHRPAGLDRLIARAEAGEAAGTLQTSLMTLVQDRLARASDGHQETASDHALGLIRRTGGQVRMSRLAQQLDLSERTLNRQISGTTGLSPKAYARLVRLGRIAQSADADDQPDWAGLAHDHGLVDQAHLAREFKHILGLSPARAHAERRHGVSDLSNTGVEVSAI